MATPSPGSSFIDILALFEKDPATEAIVMIGEIGGTAERRKQRLYIKANVTKPVVSYIAGVTRTLQVSAWAMLVRLFLAVKVLQMRSLRRWKMLGG